MNRNIMFFDAVIKGKINVEEEEGWLQPPRSSSNAGGGEKIYRVTQIKKDLYFTQTGANHGEL